jgi:hypothetical protein
MLRGKGEYKIRPYCPITPSPCIEESIFPRGIFAIRVPSLRFMALIRQGQTEYCECVNWGQQNRRRKVQGVSGRAAMKTDTIILPIYLSVGLYFQSTIYCVTVISAISAIGIIVESAEYISTGEDRHRATLLEKERTNVLSIFMELHLFLFHSGVHRL